MQNGEIKEKTSFTDCQFAPTQEPIEPTKFRPREYKARFARAAGFRLTEDGTVHLANGQQIQGNAGDYYLCLDQVHEMIISADIFKKLFLPKIENDL